MGVPGGKDSPSSSLLLMEGDISTAPTGGMAGGIARTIATKTAAINGGSAGISVRIFIAPDGIVGKSGLNISIDGEIGCRIVDSLRSTAKLSSISIKLRK